MVDPIHASHPLVLLAPMAGMTDVAFRSLCVDQGADITFSEMVSAKGLAYGSEKTASLMRPADNEEGIIVQIFGHEPETMAREAAHIEEMLGSALFGIDINMGCPARKIVKKGDGSALMREPDLAARIVSSVRSAISSPLSVKFRRGYLLGEETCVDFACKMEEAGADMLTIHPRFAMQYYKGSAERAAIARVVAATSVPVVGNGDVRCGADALSLLEETGCAHVMVGRGALGNPFIFHEIACALGHQPLPHSPTTIERMQMAQQHARLLAGISDAALIRMRKHGHHYVSGLPGASAARRMLSTCTTLDEFDAVFAAVSEGLT